MQYNRREHSNKGLLKNGSEFCSINVKIIKFSKKIQALLASISTLIPGQLRVNNKTEIFVLRHHLYRLSFHQRQSGGGRPTPDASRVQDTNMK